MAGRLLPAAVAGLAALLLGLPTLVMPLHPDQALFAMVGRAVARGRFPYIDAWDFKTPALYLIYTAAIQGPFELARNVRVFNLGWTAAAAVLLVELGRRWWNWRAGLIAALVYTVVWSTDTPFWQSAQPDSLAVLPILFGLLLYETTRGRWPRLVAAGLALGVAVQLRLTIALLLPVVPLVEAACAAHRTRWRLWLSRMLWLLAGAAAVQVLLLVYLAIGGALGEFVATMRYATGYIRLGGPWNPPGGPTMLAYLTILREGFWEWANPRLILTFPGMAAGVAGAFVLRDRRLLQLFLFVLLSYAGIALQGKFFWYHYGYMVPFLALLGGWGWDRVLDALCRSLPAASALPITGLLAAVLLLGSAEIWDNGLDNWRAYLRYERRPTERLGASLATPGFRAEADVAAYVRERTRPGDSIYVWGFDPALYDLSGRAPASRFLLSYPLMSSWSPPRWQREFVEDLEARRPAYIIVQRSDPGTWIVGHDISTVDYIGHYPQFQRILAQDYEQEQEISDRILYRRR